MDAAVIRIIAIALFMLTAAAQDRSVLQVKVVDIGQNGVEGAMLEFRPSDNTLNTVRVSTGPAGSVAVPDLAAGTYRVFVSKQGFEGREPMGTAVRWQGSAGTDPLVLRLVPLGSITGRVFNAEGNPLPQVQVEIFRPAFRGQRTLVLTKADGAYRFENCSPGTYLLRARPGSDTDAGRQTFWAPVYYPGDRTAATVEPITVLAGEHLTGRDLRLRPVSVFAIRGTVPDESGHASGVTVILQPVGASFGPTMIPSTAITKTAADGGFLFDRIGEGDWDLIAVRKDADGVESVGRTRVHVTKHDVEEIRIRLSRPFAMDVSYVWESSGPPDPRPGPQVMLIPVDGPAEQMKYSGNQRIREIYPGRYRISVGVRPGYYLAGLWLGESDVLGREVELGPESPALRIEYKKNGGRISGRVENGKSCMVIIKMEVMNDPPFQILSCETGGAFRSDVLRPGRYRVWAFEEVDWDAWSFPAFQQAVDQLATRVDVEAGENVSLELRLRMWPR